MKSISTLFAVLVLVLIPSNLPALPNPPEGKFLQSDVNIIGMESGDLEQALGKPNAKEPKGCKFPVDEKGGAIEGTAWSYSFQSENLRASLQVCLFKNVAVAYIQRVIVNNQGEVRRAEKEAISVVKILELLKEDRRSNGTQHPAIKGGLPI